MRHSQQVVVGAGIALVIACTKGGPVIPPVPKLKSNLAVLASAHGVLVGPRAAQSSSGLSEAQAGATGGGTPTDLYVLNADNSLTVTSVMEGEDGGITSENATVRPLAAFDTGKYLLIGFEGLTVDDHPCTYVLARKSDGALFCVPVSVSTDGDQVLTAPDTLDLYVIRESYVHGDSSGNILWVNYVDALKVDLTDPAAPGVTFPIDAAGGAGHRWSWLAVNGIGDALLAESGQVRLQKAAGGFQNVSTARASCPNAGFAANPDDFYFFESGATFADGTRLIKLTHGPSSYTRSDMGLLPDTGDITAQLDCSTGRVHADDAFYTAAATTLAKVTDLGVTSFSVPTLTKVTRVVGAPSAVMLLGQDSLGNGGIVKFDTGTAQFSTLVTPGDYVISQISAASNGDVTFSGQRASDGAFVLGNVPAGTQTVEILSSTLPNVISLVRLN